MGCSHHQYAMNYSIQNKCGKNENRVISKHRLFSRLSCLQVNFMFRDISTLIIVVNQSFPGRVTASDVKKSCSVSFSALHLFLYFFHFFHHVRGQLSGRAILHFINRTIHVPNNKKSRQLGFFLLKQIWRRPALFCGSTNTPVLDFWLRLLWLSKPEWIPSLACFVTCMKQNPQIHLWCNTC